MHSGRPQKMAIAMSKAGKKKSKKKGKLSHEFGESGY